MKDVFEALLGGVTTPEAAAYQLALVVSEVRAALKEGRLPRTTAHWSDAACATAEALYGALSTKEAPIVGPKTSQPEVTRSEGTPLLVRDEKEQWEATGLPTIPTLLGRTLVCVWARAVVEGGSEGELGFCSFLARETQDQLPPEAATAFGAGLDRLMEDMLNRLQGGTRHLN